LSCTEKAFRRLGGVTRVVVLDNLREGVITPDIYDATLNLLYRDVAKPHQTATGGSFRLLHPSSPWVLGANNSSTVTDWAIIRCSRAYWIISSSACRLGSMP